MVFYRRRRMVQILYKKYWINEILHERNIGWSKGFYVLSDWFNNDYETESLQNVRMSSDNGKVQITTLMLRRGALLEEFHVLDSWTFVRPKIITTIGPASPINQDTAPRSNFFLEEEWDCSWLAALVANPICRNPPKSQRAQYSTSWIQYTIQIKTDTKYKDTKKHKYKPTQLISNPICRNPPMSQQAPAQYSTSWIQWETQIKTDTKIQIHSKCIFKAHQIHLHKITNSKAQIKSFTNGITRRQKNL